MKVKCNEVGWMTKKLCFVTISLISRDFCFKGEIHMLVLSVEEEYKRWDYIGRENFNC
jgi:hypothetical protein